jgi:hypothetical protein
VHGSSDRSRGAVRIDGGRGEIHGERAMGSPRAAVGALQEDRNYFLNSTL